MSTIIMGLARGKWANIATGNTVVEKLCPPPPPQLATHCIQRVINKNSKYKQNYLIKKYKNKLKPLMEIFVSTHVTSAQVSRMTQEARSSVCACTSLMVGGMMLTVE